MLVAAGCDDGHRVKVKYAVIRAVPRSLADGSMPARLPPALHRFRGRPVVGARELPKRAALHACRAASVGGEEARFAAAWLSTEGVSAQYVLRDSWLLVACDAVYVARRWVRCGFTAARSRNPQRIELSGGGLSVACDELGGNRPFMWIALPRAADWTLVDHATYWAAYASKGRRLLRISLLPGNKFRVRVAFVDARGRVLREREARGYVAG